jgi:tRNA dimethylallyltransferase
MYLESVLLDYDLVEVPENMELRQSLAGLPDEELIRMISSARPLHNSTDTSDRERLTRALEIEFFKKDHANQHSWPGFSNTPVLGIRFDRETIRNRITQRLNQRLEEGMIDEVKHLIEKGVSADRLLFYGLEYKYITLYLKGELSYSQMVGLLNTAIHQFAKRQMTWFRRMEKKGVRIFWLEGEKGLDANIAEAMSYLNTVKA